MHALKVLFVCSRNRRRSLTAEEIFRGMPGIEVRSAGTQPGARVVVTEGMAGWADLILAMEKSHLGKMRDRFPEVIAKKYAVAVHIRDEYEFMQAELIDELRASAEPIIRELLDARARGGAA